MRLADGRNPFRHNELGAISPAPWPPGRDRRYDATVKNLVALVAAVIALELCACAGSALAQGRLDRDPLALPEPPGPAPPVSVTGAAPPPSLFGISLQPSATKDPNAHGYGFAVLVRNGTLLGALPLGASLAYKSATTGSTHRNKFQIGGSYTPALGASLSLAVLGDYGWIEGGSTSGEISSELDYNLPRPANSYAGAVVYYDSQTLTGFGSPHGATAGLTAGVGFGEWTSLTGEYDFKSDFAGQDSWSAQVAQVLTAAPKLTLVVGAQKGSSLLAALRANLPEIRRHRPE